MRDLLIGLTVILADGSIVRGGGKVVKNVAGYDLPKLVIGSFGTLGVVVEATFKLRPRPTRTGSSSRASSGSRTRARRCGP
jgi:glycolate oxidase FAD binding subunit